MPASGSCGLLIPHSWPHLGLEEQIAFIATMARSWVGARRPGNPEVINQRSVRLPDSGHPAGTISAGLSLVAVFVRLGDSLATFIGSTGFGFDETRQPGDSFDDIFLTEVTDGKPDAVVPSSIRVKVRHGRPDDAEILRRVGQRGIICVERNAHSKEEASAGLVPAHPESRSAICRKALIESAQRRSHGVPVKGGRLDVVFRDPAAGRKKHSRHGRLAQR